MLLGKIEIDGVFYSVYRCSFCETLHRESGSRQIDSSITACDYCSLSLLSAPEEWRNLPSYQNISCSSWGRVKTQWNPETLRQSVGSKGEMMVRIFINRKRKNLRVHRLVCEAFHGSPPPEKSHVNHINSVRSDNRAENLEWVSHKENLSHAGFGNMNRFSEVEDQHLIEGVASGKKKRQIAQELGRTLKSVKGRWQVLKRGIRQKSEHKS